MADSESNPPGPILTPGRWYGADIYVQGDLFSSPILVLDYLSLLEELVFGIKFRAADPNLSAVDDGWLLRVDSHTPHTLSCTRVKGRMCEPLDCIVIFSTLSEGWLAKRFPIEATEYHNHGESIIKSAYHPFPWDEPFPFESENYFTENEVMGYCAFRFKGHQFARIQHDSLSLRTDLLNLRKPESKSPMDDFATFYAFMCDELKWGRKCGITTKPESRRCMELFLRLCETAPPSEYQHSDFMREWNRLFVPVLAECRAAIAERVKIIEGLNRTYGECRCYVSAGGQFIVRQPEATIIAAFFFDPIKNKLLVARNPGGPGAFEWAANSESEEVIKRSKGQPWADALHTYKVLNLTRAIVDRPTDIPPRAAKY